MNEPPSDGYLDALVFRRLSRPVTRRLLHTSLSPNAVTLTGTAVGVTGGLALALPWPLGAAASVVLLACSSVLDCCDGDLARARRAESRLGHALDVTGDTLVHGALFAGMTLALGRAGAFPGWPLLVVLATGVAGAFVAITWSERTLTQRHRASCWENRALDDVLSPLSTRDWYVFPLAFAIAGRLDLLVAGAAVGAHVFWASVVVLMVRALRLRPGQ